MFQWGHRIMGMPRRSLGPVGLAVLIGVGGVAGCTTLGLDSSDEPVRRVLPLAFAGEAHFAALTGLKGKSAILEPVGQDLAVERISWRRIGKLPCFMQVYKRSPANADQVAIDKSDLCEGAKGDESPIKSVGELNAPFAPTMRVITAIRGCFPKKGNGLRLAALEAEISELRPDGSVSAPQTGKDDRFAGGFDDCGQLSEWSRCQPGEIGIGVRTHFNKALGSQFIVGLELQCRSVVPSRAVARGGLSDNATTSLAPNTPQ